MIAKTGIPLCACADRILLESGTTESVTIKIGPVRILILNFVFWKPDDDETFFILIFLKIDKKD